MRRIAEHVHEHELRHAAWAKGGVLQKVENVRRKGQQRECFLLFLPHLVTELSTELSGLLRDESALLRRRLAVADGLRDVALATRELHKRTFCFSKLNQLHFSVNTTRFLFH